MDLTISNTFSQAIDSLLQSIITNAHATDAPAQTAGLADFLPLILLFVVFYFMLIRPQMKRAKDHKLLVEGTTKGDEVAINGGLVGKVTDLGENFILLQIAPDTEVKVQRQAISAVLPKGTIKTL